VLDRSLLGSSGSLSLLLSLSVTSGLLLLDILREELFVLGGGLLGGLVAVLNGSLLKLLSAEALLGDQTLDLRGLVMSLITTLDFTGNNVLAHIILLWVKAEDGGNLVLSLLEESVRDILVSAAFDLLVTLLHNLEGNDSKIRSSDATADRTSSSVTSSLWVEERSLFLEENARSSLLHDTLLHSEALSVVSAGNFECVALVGFSHDLSINFLAHSFFIERTTANKHAKLVKRDKVEFHRSDH